MRSVVVVEAQSTGSGATHLTRMESSGAIAVRRTERNGVHFVGTAAGPVGDDVIHVVVRVGPEATLTVDGVAAAIALSSKDAGVSLVELVVEVSSGGRLVLSMPPLIVTANADVESSTELSVEGDAYVDVTEHIVLGRHGERGGRWRGRLAVDVAGRPVLRQTQTSSSVLDSIAEVGGALVTRFVCDPSTPPGPTTSSGMAFWVPLAGTGTLVSSYGFDLASAVQDATGCQLRG